MRWPPPSATVDDWGPSGLRVGQYAADLVADDVALRLLREAGVGILSEESGAERADAEVLVVVDPLDGSTNASRGVPWFATRSAPSTPAGRWPRSSPTWPTAIGTRRCEGGAPAATGRR